MEYSVATNFPFSINVFSVGNSEGKYIFTDGQLMSHGKELVGNFFLTDGITDGKYIN